MVLQVQDLDVLIEEEGLFEPVTFSLHTGQIVQIKGPNGVGKTTLLKTLCGLYSNYKGMINWLEVDTGHKTLADQVVYSCVKPQYSRELTPIENLQWFCEVQGFRPNPSSVRLILDRLGLANKQWSRLDMLSSGQKQRVKLAAILLSEKPIWVLDEPFLALDIAGVALFESMIVEHVHGGGAVLLTTHHQLCWPVSHAIVTLQAMKAYNEQ